ncbi:piggyBac transposable element-derived protein 4-like [Archocentrus centrarchus]|uniref:piggyBac transposable element-derived protein 4-like n=1 Tax=Archocentrus centrarchus TaxID=63155 RepID=UPI0011EA1CB7|nr:piggyBac transposable element-derived protein 4-like [Archocentrus centrarchus]XP_030592394.1 piggyBac transposable element-derived protein 4-like [Archocentrus centrarchus]
MSVCNFPKMSDFWRKKTIFHVAFPATVMSRNRFTDITSNLHVSDPEEDTANEGRRGTEEYDPLQELKPLLEMIRTRCKSVYHPKQHISVDERMVATKARIKVKQYMKDKPTKWGLKSFVLADVNGYTVDYKLYTGKNNADSGKGLSFDVVTELVKKDYLGSGYVVYCDNFYTSPQLFHHLSQQGFGACGTYRQGRVGVPTTQENALNKNSKRGSIRWIRDGELLFVKWMDTREVSMCTTVHPVYTGETVLRWQKDNDGQSQRIPVPRPTAVAEYDKYMGGVDTSDQMFGTNSVHRKTKRWPMTVFQHLLDIAVTNSFIVHKELSKAQQQKEMIRQAFQEELSAHLLGVPLKATSLSQPAKMSAQEKRQRWEGESALCATEAHLGCVMCVMWVSVFRWTGTVSETTTAKNAWLFK